MGCLICGTPHSAAAACQRVQQIALCLNLLAVPAFLTDCLNCFVRVNHEFARIIGDPIRDRVPQTCGSLTPP